MREVRGVSKHEVKRVKLMQLVLDPKESRSGVAENSSKMGVGKVVAVPDFAEIH